MQRRVLHRICAAQSFDSWIFEGRVDLWEKYVWVCMRTNNVPPSWNFAAIAAEDGHELSEWVTAVCAHVRGSSLVRVYLRLCVHVVRVRGRA